MLRQDTSKRTVELNALRSGYAATVLEEDNVTRELFRPGIDAPDRTVELADCDLELLTPPSQSASPPPQSSDTWSLDSLVDDDEIPIIFEDEPAPTPLEPERRGLLWRLLFRLGWVKVNDGVYPLG